MSLARYMITDRHAVGGAEALLDLLRRRLNERLDYVQIREKDLEARDLFNLVTAILALPRSQNTKILVNNRLDVALAAGAHGVHLPAHSPSVATLRTIVPADFLIGASCHSVDDFRQTAADYCLFAPVFTPRSKRDARLPHGIPGLQAAVAAARVPVFALGGISESQAPEIERAGAAGIAGISLFL